MNLVVLQLYVVSILDSGFPKFLTVMAYLAYGAAYHTLMYVYNLCVSYRLILVVSYMP